MENNFFEGKRAAWVSVFFMFCFSFLGFVVIGPFLGLLLLRLFTDIDVFTFRESLFSEGDYAGMKMSLFIMQGCATLVGLLIAPLLYLRLFERKHISFLWRQPRALAPIVLAGLIVVVFMVPNSFFVEWNAGLSLSGVFENFEVWARAREQQAAQITTLLTTFHSSGEFLMAMLVVAVLPGMGEELLFRGMLQPELHRATRNPHIAILISAMLFSAIHMQFFGFLPRMLLGMLFGYLYYWSGNILVPIFAHFVNNGFALTMLYLHQLGLVSFDVESKESAPLLSIVFGTVVIFILLRYFKRMTTRS